MQHSVRYFVDRSIATSGNDEVAAGFNLVTRLDARASWSGGADQVRLDPLAPQNGDGTLEQMHVRDRLLATGL